MLLQKGFAHLFLLIIVVIAVGTGLLLFSRKNQLLKKTDAPQEAAVVLKTEYKNPFDKKDQYVNPFDQYKSPLHNLKK